MIEYIGEHLWVGQLGQFLIFLAFTTAIFSSVSYAFATNREDLENKAVAQQWQTFGRIGFIIHGISIISIIVLIFFMMINKYYEYDYVWSHVSDTLPFRYTFAAFWEGQEGSFLLWLFWHSILGFVLIKTAGKWENPVMSVLAFAQIFFVFFILGLYFDGGDPEGTSFAFLGNLYGRSGLVWLLSTIVLVWLSLRNRQSLTLKITAATPSILLFILILSGCYHLGDVRIGASPFMLLRDVHFAPIFNTPNYLESIEGTGLNPLLQNYWMTIHPPTLFLGFASTIIPCAYAIAGLWKNEHKAWMNPALKWALFSAAVLGTGIFMGGVWAYEALSFGGYWAWDPVENASLVPWITLVAGIHTTLIARATGYSTKSSYVFYLLTFLLIFYSTFLTRSGILGETSVHAFTEMGLEWQMVFFMGILTLLGWGFYAYRKKEIPAPKREESIYSREFWMFVGALVLLFSAGLISVTTSIPVINALASLEPFDTIFGTLASSLESSENTAGLGRVYNFFSVLDEANMAPPEDVVAHHNNFQLWIGVLVAILSGFVQFFGYKKDSAKGIMGMKYLGISLVAALAMGIPLMYASGILAWQYWLLVITGLFALFSNLLYLIGVAKGNMKLAGSVFSHAGFGIMLVGVVFSGALKYPLSDPFASQDLDGLLGDLNKQTNKNILVPLGQAVQLTDGFTVRYTKNWVEGNAQFHELSFIRKDKKGNIIDRFTTQPNVLLDTLPNKQLKFRAANPNTKHYLDRDVFTLAVPHWAFFDENAEKQADTTTWQPQVISMNDTFYTNRYYVVYTGIDSKIPEHEAYEHQAGDIPLTAMLSVHDINSGMQYDSKVLYYIRANRAYAPVTKEEKLGLEFKLSKVIPKDGKVVIEFKDKTPKRDYVVIQALIFPGIQLVWIGCILMMFGLLFSGLQRIQIKRKQTAA